MNVALVSYHIAFALTVSLYVVAIAFAYFRIDDFVFDIAFWISWIRRWNIRRRYEPFTAANLHRKAQQRIAIFVPCWHEEDVVEQMVEFTSHHVDYDRYDLLIGVYPNDEATLDKVRRVSRRYPNVHAIVNERPGPTTKAQNLNNIYRGMRAIEGDDPFRIIVLHDVEDVVHPLSLRLYNHLLPEKQMVQIPVFPLERKWSEFIAWTYADEFARNHSKDMHLRETIGAFVPSAGVGTAFSREALEAVAESSDDLFPEQALTEDYQFALRMHEQGLQTIFVMRRLSPEGKRRPATAAAYVATREYFPGDFWAAVRQKSRWVAGICLQSWREIGWRGNIPTRYTLYRDRKASAANLFALTGWAVLLAVGAMHLIHLFVPQIAAPWVGSDRATILLFAFVLFGTLIELIQTACFVAWIYGPINGILSILRAPVVAAINGFATISALNVFTRSLLAHRPMAWSKTDHSFPSAGELSEFRRQLGTLLVERGSITASDLEAGLTEQQTSGGLIGEILLRHGHVTETALTDALAVQNGLQTVNPVSVRFNPRCAGTISPQRWEELGAVPIGMIDNRVHIAFSQVPRDEVVAQLELGLEAEIVIGLTTPTAIHSAFIAVPPSESASA